MGIDIVIPGKAYEIASGSRDVKFETRLKLKNSEKRKKGRGYRVFATDLTEEQVSELAEFFGSLTLSELSLVDAQAVRNATERFYAASGSAPVERPKPQGGGKGGHMREATADAIWEVIYPLVESRNCKCQLRKGMTIDELRELGAGCTDPHDLKYNILKLPKPKDRATRIMAIYDPSGYVCPTLDAYRRAVDKLSPNTQTNISK